MKLITNRIKIKSKCFTELYIRVEFIFEEYASVNPLIVKLTINTAATIRTELIKKQRSLAAIGEKYEDPLLYNENKWSRG